MIEKTWVPCMGLHLAVSKVQREGRVKEKVFVREREREREGE